MTDSTPDLCRDRSESAVIAWWYPFALLGAFLLVTVVARRVGGWLGRRHRDH